jgi:hypothetical protein
MKVVTLFFFLMKRLSENWSVRDKTYKAGLEPTRYHIKEYESGDETENRYYYKTGTRF